MVRCRRQGWPRGRNPYGVLLRHRSFVCRLSCSLAAGSLCPGTGEPAGEYAAAGLVLGAWAPRKDHLSGRSLPMADRTNRTVDTVDPVDVGRCRSRLDDLLSIPSDAGALAGAEYYLRN